MMRLIEGQANPSRLPSGIAGQCGGRLGESMQGAGAGGFDAGAIVGQIQRLARLDTTVFDEVRDAQKETVSAIVVAAVSIVVASFGAWLWIEFEDFLPPDTGKVITRILILGSLLTFGMWVVWALVSQVVLMNLFGVAADRMALLRCMGFAAAPAALMLLILIPTLSFGIGLAAVVAWFALTNYAIQAAAPMARPNQVIIANFIGFAVFAIVLSIIADGTGISSGIFIRTADASELY